MPSRTSIWSWEDYAYARAARTPRPVLAALLAQVGPSRQVMAGCGWIRVVQSRNPVTGTQVSVYEVPPSRAVGLRGRWVAVCDDHDEGGIRYCRTRSSALARQGDPHRWCSGCDLVAWAIANPNRAMLDAAADLAALRELSPAPLGPGVAVGCAGMDSPVFQQIPRGEPYHLAPPIQ